MAKSKERNDKPEIKFSTLKQQVAAVTAKVDMMVEEMRDRDNQRAKEIMELRQKHDADIKELNAKIDSKFDKLSSQIQSLTIAAVVGIGAIVIGGGAIIWSAISSLK